MPDETEPTPATPPPHAAEAPTAETDAAPAATDAAPTGRSGVQVPKWLAVGVIAAVLAGGGFAVGRATASEHHGDFAPIGDNRGRGPGPPGDGGGPGGSRGPGRGFGGNGGNGGPNLPGDDSDGGANAPTSRPPTSGTAGA